MRPTEIKRAVSCFAVLLALYLLYGLAVAPLIEPQVKTRRSARGTVAAAPVTSAADRYREDLEGLFPEGSWENQSPKILSHRNTLLLFQDYQPNDDGTVHVFPCTVVMHDDEGDADRAAIILQASEGAVLQLNEAISLRTGRMGQPMAGRLLGKIEVRSPGDRAGKGRLHFTTHDVHINPQQLWTTHDVDLRYEGSRARGRDLLIKLLPMRRRRSSESTARGWAGIRSVELVKLDSLRLDLSDSTTDPPAQRQEPPLDITCAGPLRIDFFENRLTLDDSVVIHRNLPDGKRDEIRCDQLALSFQKQVNKDAPRAKERRPASGSPKPKRFVDAPPLELTRVMAFGSPVIVNAVSRNTYLRGKKMLYDLKLGRFRLWTRTAEGGDQVWIRHKEHEITARDVDCQLDEAGELVAARLRGPGRIDGTVPRDGAAEPARVHWSKLFSIVKEQTLFHLTLENGARVAVGQDSGIDADVLHLWLEPAPQTLPGPATTGIDAREASHRAVSSA